MDINHAVVSEARISASLSKHLIELGSRLPASPEILNNHGFGVWPATFEEHCHECGAPSCYATCSLFRPASGGKCRRFRFGIELNKWENWEPGQTVDLVFDDWALLKVKSCGLSSDIWKFGFLLQMDVVGVPHATYSATFTITPTPYSPSSPAFCQKLTIDSGITELFVNPAELEFLKGHANIEASLAFEEGPRPTLVRLFTAHFVEGVTSRFGRVAAKKLLLVDLDNTLWDGIVDEDQEIKLKPHVVEGLTALHERRVAIMALSRASLEAARAAGEALGLIGLIDQWHCDVVSKAGCISMIAKDASVLHREIVFLDDDPVEREMMSRECPDVTVLEPQNFSLLRWHPVFASALRPSRNFESCSESLHCNKTAALEFRSPKENELLRCWELTQRANRMQCVEWRPTYAELINWYADKEAILRVGICSDEYANYGLVCIAALQLKQDIIVLHGLVFSCRIGFRSFPKMFMEELLGEMQTLSPAFKIDGGPGVNASATAHDLYKALEDRLLCSNGHSKHSDLRKEGTHC